MERESLTLISSFSIIPKSICDELLETTIKPKHREL
jgi:hypothetical protein